MKNKAIILVKNAIRTALTNAKFTGENTKKKYLFIGLYIFLVIYMGGFSFAMSFLMFDTVREQASAEALLPFIPVIMFFVTSVFIFATSIFSASGVLFNAKDLEMQLAMPISHFSILSCKFMGLYFMNLIFSLMILIPNCIIYFVYAPFNAVALIGYIVAIFIAPFLPTLLGSILSAIMTIALRKFRMKNILIILASIAFFVVYMQFFMNIQNSMQYITQNTEALFNSFSSIYFPSLFFYKSITGSLVHILLYIATSLIPVIIVIRIMAIYLSKFIAAANQSFVKSNYKLTEQKTSTKIKAATKKELTQYFSSALYVLNTAIMLILLTVGSIYSIISKSGFINILTQIIEENDISEMFLMVLISAITITACMSSTTAHSISIEGSRLWIYKSAPIDEKNIFNAKINVSMIIGLPLIFINVVIFTFVFDFSVLNMLFMIFIPSMALYVAAITGLIVNLAMPKLNWTNEAMVIKQSKSALVSMLCYISIALLIIIPGFLLFKIIDQTIILSGASLLLVVLFIILRKVLFTYGINKFNTLTIDS